VNPEQLSATIVDALAALVTDGAITLPDGVPTQVTVERPRQKGHGDYATNVALQLAKAVLIDGQGTNPRAFAELVAERLRAAGGISEVEVAGPGFLNVSVEAGAQGQVAADIVAAGASYGSATTLSGQRVNVDRAAAPGRNPVGGGG
jgi:arginyl-tRNA synthetase